jgi:hypothetical protein
MSQDLSRRAVLAGTAAAIPASALSVSLAQEPDPVFAAIEAHKRADAAFIARAMFEDELAERGIKPPKTEADYRSAEMVEVVEASIATRVALAKTIPTTPAGLLAVLHFVREQSKDFFFFEDGAPTAEDECLAFIASIEASVKAMIGQVLS